MSGKLIFTEFDKKKLVLLFSENRLTAVRVRPEEKGRIGAVYIGKVKKMAPNIDACFVEIQNGEICFLSLKDAKAPFLLNRSYDGRLIEGDELAVQLVREAQKTKQASVSAKISISNEYFVLNLEGSSRVGYSGKLSQERKEELQELLTSHGILKNKKLVQSPFVLPDISIPKIGGVVRTQAAEAGEEELLNGFYSLCEDFSALLKAAPYRTCYTCLKEAPPVYQDVLDTFAYPDEYDEIVTDDTALFEELSTFCKEKLPDKRVRLYTDASYPLHKLYSIETRLKETLDKRVWLKSGGYLVIEPTEALTVIDVNSGKYEGKKKLSASDDNACHVNLEAAREIALQLRLRNLSGIIIADFISMESREQQDTLLQLLRRLVRKDKQKTSVVDMTPLGLVEITRKKCDKPLYEQLS